MDRGQLNILRFCFHMTRITLSAPSTVICGFQFQRLSVSVAPLHDW